MITFKDTDLREALRHKYANTPTLPADFMVRKDHGDVAMRRYVSHLRNDKLEVPVFEEVRGGMMATIKREKFIAIQAKGGDIENDKDVVDVVIENVVEKLSERQLVIYKMIRKSVVDGVVETASSIASKIKLSPRTIQRDLTRLKDLNVIKHEGPDNGGCWVVLMDLNV